LHSSLKLEKITGTHIFYKWKFKTKHSLLMIDLILYKKITGFILILFKDYKRFLFNITIPNYILHKFENLYYFWPLKKRSFTISLSVKMIQMLN
jgi:hypothetical protein